LTFTCSSAIATGKEKGERDVLGRDSDSPGRLREGEWMIRRSLPLSSAIKRGEKKREGREKSAQSSPGRGTGAVTRKRWATVIHGFEEKERCSESSRGCSKRGRAGDPALSRCAHRFAKKKGEREAFYFTLGVLKKGRKRRNHELRENRQYFGGRIIRHMGGGKDGKNLFVARYGE